MESLKVESLSFTYPGKDNKTLDNISFTVNRGDFLTVCGKSGCGKTTLLRLLKPALAPSGKVCGKVYLDGNLMETTDPKEQASKIGFVMQSPDNQIVTDKVWHELAFGLESLGFSTSEIRTRVSEMASFFGIDTWFHKKVTELSGGQKQLLNLASVMVMQPSLLILDEPTSQLDPISASEFLKTLERISRELGTAIILTEHRLEEVFPISDKVIVMDSGKIIAAGSPQQIYGELKSQNHDMYRALPTPVRVFGAFENSPECPMTVREGRLWLEEYTKTNKPREDLIPHNSSAETSKEPVIEIKDAYFRYEKNLPDVVKGLNLVVRKGEFFAILGGNGTGKTTALSLMSGLNKPYRGQVLIKGRSISKTENLYNGVLGVLPQNPQSVFVKNTVYSDLMEMLPYRKITKEEKAEMIHNISALCRIQNVLYSHPYDLSGGEQQRAALAKVLLGTPKILLLDEPTKGMDTHFKEEFGQILKDLQATGVTVIMVSHDIEFCAEFADKCAMFFDGTITSSGSAREFFGGNSFYTTSANRMARTTLPSAVLADDIILALGGEVKKKERPEPPEYIHKKELETETDNIKRKHLTPARIVAGSIFALLFVLSAIFFVTDWDIFDFARENSVISGVLQAVSIVFASISLFCFLPQKEIGIRGDSSKSGLKITKRTLAEVILILGLIPLTIYFGMNFFGERKYYIVSLLVILETMIPFFMQFEKRKPRARELVIISVLCAIGVAGRAAFFMLPQFKPVIALIIITGVCFGGETGFLVGALTAFVSGFFFGQGPWTPWQMFALGIIGFIAGVLFGKGALKKTKISLCIFGIIATLLIYGGIMNPASVIMWQNKITAEMILTAYLAGIPFDLIHALSTAFFLWFISEPMMDKLDRTKVKYGLIVG